MGLGARADVMRRSGVARLAEPSLPGFVGRFALVALALLLLPWAVAQTHPSGPLAYLIPATAALVVLAAYLWRPAEALLAFVLFAVLIDTVAVHVGPQLKQADDVSVILLFPVAFVRVVPSWRAWSSLPREVAIGALVVIGILSSLFAGVPINIWVPALYLLLKGIAFLYVVTWTEFRSWEIRSGMLVGFVAGVTVMALGLVELLAPVQFQQFFGLEAYVRFRSEALVVKSVFEQPAIFGYFTTFVALFAYAQYVTSLRARWLVAAVFLSIGAFLSARRRAILALGAGLLAALADSFRWLHGLRPMLRRWIPVTASVVLLVVLFMPGLGGLYEITVQRYISTVVLEIKDEPGVIEPGLIAEDNPQARVALYFGSLDIARDYFPLGAGLGRYGSWMSRVEYSPVYYEYDLNTVRGLRPRNSASATDTFWPQILGELGVVGLLAYVGFLATIGLLLWREARRPDEPLMRTFRLAAGMVFAQALAESVASSMYHSPPRIYLLYLVVGVVISFAWRRRAAAPE
jgi:O-Antigen ligase